MPRAAGRPWYAAGLLVAVVIGLVTSMASGVVAPPAATATNVGSQPGSLRTAGGAATESVNAPAPGTPAATAAPDGASPPGSVNSLSLLNNTLGAGWPNYSALRTAGALVADPVDGLDIAVGTCEGAVGPDTCLTIAAASGPTPLGVETIDQCDPEFVGAQSAIANPVNGQLYLGCGNGTVAVVDPLSGVVVARVPAPTPTEFPLGCPTLNLTALTGPVEGLAIDPNDGVLFVMSVSFCSTDQSPYPSNATVEEVSMATDLPVWNFSFQSVPSLQNYLGEPLAFDPGADQLVVSTYLNGSSLDGPGAYLVDPASPGFVGALSIVGSALPEVPVVYLPSTGSVYAVMLSFDGPPSTPVSDTILRLDLATETATAVYVRSVNPVETPLPVGDSLSAAGGGSATIAITGNWLFTRNETNFALAPTSEEALWFFNVTSGVASATIGLPGSGIATVAGPAATTLFLDGLDDELVRVADSPPAIEGTAAIGGLPALAAVDPADGTAWFPLGGPCAVYLEEPCSNTSLVELSGISQHVVGTYPLPPGQPIGVGFDPVDQEIFVLTSCAYHGAAGSCFDQPNGTISAYASNGSIVAEAAVTAVSEFGAERPLTFDPNASLMIAGEASLRGLAELLLIPTAAPNESFAVPLPAPPLDLCEFPPSVTYDGGSGLVLAYSECFDGSGYAGRLWAYNATTFLPVYNASEPLGWDGLEYDPGTAHLFATNGSGLYVLAAGNGTIEQYLPVPGGAVELAGDPVSDTLYTLGSNLSAINATTLTVATVAVLPSGSAVDYGYISVDPTLGTLYLPDTVADAVVFVAAPGPATYRVSFPEAGLPDGQTWTVSIAGTSETSFGTLSFGLRNGTYSYSIGPVVGYRLDGPHVGTVDVAGANVTLPPVQFLPNFYTLNFDGSGGPWLVYLDGPNGPVPTSACGTTPGEGITSCLVKNGTYHYLLVGAAGTVVGGAPPGGAVTIAGASASVSFRLSPGATAGLAFHESGLPSGTSWCAVVDAAGVVCSTSSVATLSNLTPGVYAYVIEGVPGFTAKVASGSVSLTHARTVAVAFRVATTVLTFTESGLADRHRWTVVVDGRSYSTTQPQEEVAVPNGTVSYEVPAIAGYLGHLAGNVTVTGVPRSVPVMFTRVTYLVTITETGLTAGQVWSVVVGGEEYSSNATTIVFEEPNGSYAVHLVTEPGYSASVTPHSVRIDGGAASAAVVYRPATRGGSPAGATPVSMSGSRLRRALPD